MRPVYNPAMQLQVGVKVLLKNDEGKILLVKRTPQTYGKTSGSWDIVGGRIEPGSGLIENLRREIREEAQLEMTSEPRLIAAQDIMPTAEKHVVRLTYTAHTRGEPILDMAENCEYRWLSLEEIAAESDLDTYVRKLLDEGRITEESWV